MNPTETAPQPFTPAEPIQAPVPEINASQGIAKRTYAFLGVFVVIAGAAIATILIANNNQSATVAQNSANTPITTVATTTLSATPTTTLTPSVVTQNNLDTQSTAISNSLNSLDTNLNNATNGLNDQQPNLN